MKKGTSFKIKTIIDQKNGKYFFLNFLFIFSYTISDKRRVEHFGNFKFLPKDRLVSRYPKT